MVAAVSRTVSLRTRDYDAPDAAEVGIGHLEVQDLTRNVGNGRIGGTQVNPGTDVCYVRVHDKARKERSVFWSERRDDRISRQLSMTLVLRVALLSDLCQVTSHQVKNTGTEMFIGHRSGDKGSLDKECEFMRLKQAVRFLSYSRVQNLTILHVSEGLFTRRVVLPNMEYRAHGAILATILGKAVAHHYEP